MFEGPAFVGGICNPIAEARMNDGISITTLGKKLGVSKQYISRAEQGTYPSLNDGLVRYASEQLNIRRGEFVNKYKEFQKATRLATVENVNPVKLTRRSKSTPGNVIFSNWRSGYWPSIISFCNAFCLHPEIVTNYEQGARQGMPLMMREILTSLGVMDEDWKDAVEAEEKSPSNKAKTMSNNRRLMEMSPGEMPKNRRP